MGTEVRGANTAGWAEEHTHAQRRGAPLIRNYEMISNINTKSI